MSNLIPFTFDQLNVTIRATNVNGEPWFVASDISNALGYSETSRALRHCKRSTILVDVNKINKLHPSTKWIPEPDLYRLIINSTLPSAERFEKWVMEDVLPSIRKTGGYQVEAQQNKVSISALEYVRYVKEMLPNLGESSIQVLISEASLVDFNRRLLPLPTVNERFYTATEIAKEVGTTSNRVGRVANSLDLKRAKYGEYRLGKSKSSDRIVEHFFYNELGRSLIVRQLSSK